MIHESWQRLTSVLLIIAVSSLIFGTATPSRSQVLTPDTLVTLAQVQLANSNTDSARILLNSALQQQPRFAPAAMLLGRILSEAGSADSASAFFQIAEESDPDKGYREYGEGIALLQQEEYDDAKRKFQRAFRKNDHFVEALLQVARVQSRSFVSRFAAKRTYRRITELEPRHPSAYYELGRLYERTRDYDQAAEKYEQQLRVNRTHVESAIRLGYLYLDKNRNWHARQRLFDALQHCVGKDVELSLAVAATYMGDKQFDMAYQYYAQALQMMTDEERGRYEDISNIASNQEIAYYRRVSGEQRIQFLRKFWLRRDPTPITIVNERMLEHFRRIWYAAIHFADTRQPWDDRGTIYIRYGEPDHQTSSSDPNFQTSVEVDNVRERNLHGIYGTDVPLSLLSPGLPAYPLIDPNEILNDPEYNRDMSNPFSTGTTTEEEESSDSQDDPFEQNVQSPTSSLPGAMNMQKWEEWVYTRVAGGLVITFHDRLGNGEYRYATPPSTTDLSMATVLQQYAPITQVGNAQRETPELYIYDEEMEPLDFYYYTAQFRAPDDETQMDIYYGIPTGELVFEQHALNEFKAELESGFAVFDTLWNVKLQVRNRIDLTSSTPPIRERGTIHVDRRSMFLRGNQRIRLSVQVKDVKSGRVQAYQNDVLVTQYDSSSLAMSDIVLAGNITRINPADSTRARSKFVRNGLSILPMASKAFRPGQSMHVYFEVYNLARGSEYGETEYEVEHSIRRGGIGSRGSIIGAIGRFLSGSRQEVGVSRVIEGLRSSEFQHFTLDTSNLPQGEYTLIVTVRDRKSNQSTIRECSFWVGI